MKKALLAILLAIVLASCSTGSGYSGFSPVDPAGWAYGDTLYFTPEMPDSITAGSISVAVCHNDAYPYSRLYLEVLYPSGATMCRDTIEMTLCDPYGRWRGKHIGSTYQMVGNLDEKIRVHRGTPFAVVHIMRDDTLRGIEQVGLNFLPLDGQ